MIALKTILAILMLYILWSLTHLVLYLRKIIYFFKSIIKQQNQNSPKQYMRNTMVKCAKCQLYIISKDAVNHNGNYFCSSEHAHDFNI